MQNVSVNYFSLLLLQHLSIIYLSTNPIEYIYFSTFSALINFHFYYRLLFNNLLPSLPRFLTQDTKYYHIHVFIGRQSIRSYYQNLEAIGHQLQCCRLLCFESVATIVHLVLISLLGSVYYSCFQHYHRTRSS